MATSASMTPHPPHGATGGTDWRTKHAVESTMMIMVTSRSRAASGDDLGLFSSVCARDRQLGAMIIDGCVVLEVDPAEASGSAIDE